MQRNTTIQDARQWLDDSCDSLDTVIHQSRKVRADVRGVYGKNEDLVEHLQNVA